MGQKFDIVGFLSWNPFIPEAGERTLVAREFLPIAPPDDGGGDDGDGDGDDDDGGDDDGDGGEVEPLPVPVPDDPEGR